MRQHLALAGLAALAAAAFPTTAEAMKLHPMSQVLAPSGSQATGSYEVTNDTAEAIAVEVSVTTLALDLDYRETNVPADDDFLVYPAQMIVPPGGRQTVRVTWLGAPRLPRERAYRLVAEQLPIERLRPGATPAPLPAGQVRILMKYRATLFVRPRGATAKLALAGLRAATSADGRPGLELVVENRGTARGVLRRCALTVAAGQTTVPLGPDALRVLDRTTVPAKGRRRYLLPAPKGVTPGDVTGKLACASES